MREVRRRPVTIGLTAEGFLQALRGACARLEAQREQINHLNVFPVPDGDTGTNMVLTLQAALKEAEAAWEGPDASLGHVARACARGSLWGARGNSGVILSQFLKGWADGLRGCTVADPERVVQAMERAVATAFRAVLEPVEGTMLTVGRAAAVAAKGRLKTSRSLPFLWRAACRGARKALANTPNQLPVLKRAGVVDAGGMGLVGILEGSLMGVLSADHDELVDASAVLQEAAPPQAPAVVVSPPEEPDRAPAVDADPVRFESSGSDGNAADQQHHNGHGASGGPLRYIYCTEFIITGRNLSREDLQRRLSPLGDSVLVVGDEETLKVHLHTNRPGQALEIAVDLGQLTAISIDNMAEQARRKSAGSVAHASEAFAEEREEGPGLVAVAPGAGLADLFRSLGADAVVSGGPTMNPSTRQLAEAIRSVPRSSVVLLPNDKNVVSAAQQAASLVDGQRVWVVPSKTVPEGVAAALAFRPLAPEEQQRSEAVEELVRDMEEAMASVRSGEVTVAVRDYNDGTRQVRAGDVIAVDGQAVVAAGTDRMEVTVELARALGAEEAGAITLYYGQDVSEEEAATVAARLKALYPDADVEVYPGGQPHHAYLMAVE